MVSTVITSNCTIRECARVGELHLDPCDDTNFYTCVNSIPFNLKLKIQSCGDGTHFTGKGCGNMGTTSEKKKLWKACKIKNLSTEKCREVWPKDGKWDRTKIHEFISNSPGKNSLLVPVILIPLLLLFFLACTIAFLIRRKKYKQTDPNIRNNNNIQPENKEDEDDHIYEEIDEDKIITTVPALAVDVSEINQGAFIDTDNQEGDYNVLDIDLIDTDNQEGDYNVLDIDLIDTDNQEGDYNVLDIDLIDTDNQEGDYDVLDIDSIHHNLKPSGNLTEEYCKLNFNNADLSNDSTYNTVSTYK